MKQQNIQLLRHASAIYQIQLIPCYTNQLSRPVLIDLEGRIREWNGHQNRQTNNMLVPAAFRSATEYWYMCQIMGAETGL